jgi:5-methylcytosine-specific restriction endonuclease McrA
VSKGRHSSHLARLRRAAAATLPAVCPYCRQTVTAADDWDLSHIVAHSQGGPAVPGNLVPAHRRCNRGEGYRLAREAARRRRIAAADAAAQRWYGPPVRHPDRPEVEVAAPSGEVERSRVF